MGAVSRGHICPRSRLGPFPIIESGYPVGQHFDSKMERRFENPPVSANLSEGAARQVKKGWLACPAGLSSEESGTVRAESMKRNRALRFRVKQGVELRAADYFKQGPTNRANRVLTLIILPTWGRLRPSFESLTAQCPTDKLAMAKAGHGDAYGKPPLIPYHRRTQQELTPCEPGGRRASSSLPRFRLNCVRKRKFRKTHFPKLRPCVRAPVRPPRSP